MTPKALSVTRTGWGALLVLVPRVPLAALTQGRQPVGGRTLLRVLGARHVLQGVATLAVPSALTLHLGAAADALHSASAVAFAALDDRERRAASLDALVAAGWAVASMWAARATERPQHADRPIRVA